LNHWNGLTRVLDDGRIELDTNIVERSIRPIGINREKALFAGHDRGVEKWPHASIRKLNPPRVCRRPFGLSHAAMAGFSSMA
jgi:hypothetical protein